MIRLLLTIFAVGLVVSLGCWLGIVALGGPHQYAWNLDGPDGRWDNRWERDSIASGPTITRDIAWAGGERLQFDVPAIIHYTQGPVAKITATGPESWVSKLVMNGDELTIDGNMHMRNRQNTPLTFTITAPSVHRFELNSAQKLDINAYAQDDLDLQSNGAAQINASGSARRLHLQLNGAGQANLGHLVNEDADVQLNGAGQATLAATGRADIEINGVGQARLLHQPKSLNRAVHGFGNIKVEEGESADWQGDEDAKPAATPATPATPAPPAVPAKPAHKAKAA